MSTRNSESKKNSKQPQRTFTHHQKQRLLLRFSKEAEERSREFDRKVEHEISILRMRFNNRLNKILRKLWDERLETLLSVEREITPQKKLTLFEVLKQLDSVKKLNKK
ncbi:hypothetical protein DAMA08_037630 [Martiniozyma asiatica (nom. inval.)]|nr:hypothetical protein DAMA08_037630 [Martiniozyma asiatica]